MIARAVSTALKRSLAPFVFRPADARELATSPGPLGLYVHIPFCRSICSFCPYYKVRYEANRAREFADALVEEIRREGERHAQNAAQNGAGAGREREATAAARRRVTSVYYGGGTPALLLSELPRIQAAVHDAFVVDGPSAIELHPADVSPERLAALRRAGFSMASVGIQSFQYESLEALGRRGGELEAHVPSRVRAVRDAGFTTVDVDLIVGIPGQRPEHVRRDIQLAVDAGATQISTYPLISFSYTRGPALRQRGHRRRALVEAVLRAAADAGLIRTSVWTFGREETERYSSVTRNSYLGFGPSAASLLPYSFAVNHFSVDAYIRSVRAGKQPVGLVAELSLRERALFWLFWQTYTLQISRGDFREMFSREIETMFGAELTAATTCGILRREPGHYAVTGLGARLYHTVEQLYTHRYIDRVWRLSRGDARVERMAIW